MSAIKPPVMGYRIGIVGNRDLTGVDINRLEAELEKLVTQLCSGVIDVWKSHNSESGKPLYDSEKPRFYLVDALAEGADQLAANVIRKLPFDFKLSCPIPCPADDYKKYFNREEGRAQFDSLIADEKLDPVLIEMDCHFGKPELRQEGYRAAADMLLDNVDVLIAVYDPGRVSTKGGSKETHHVAQQRKMPVIHLNTADLSKITLHRKLTRFIETAEPLSNEVISNLLAATLLPSRQNDQKRIGTHKNKEHDKECISEVCRFFNEPLLHKTGWRYFLMKFAHVIYSPVWKRLYRVLKFRECQPQLKVNCMDEGVAPGMPIKPQLYSMLEEEIDGLAVQYMDTYRGSFIINFLLGAVAVFLAVVSFGGGGLNWTIAELVCLVFILITYRTNRIGLWKKKAVDYRFIAEYFRHAEKLALLGRSTQLLQPAPEHHAHHDPATTWMGWYLNAVVRAHGLFRQTVSGNSGAEVRKFSLGQSYVMSTKRTLCKDWLEDQYRYHILLSKRYRRWETGASYAMLGFFIIIVLGVLAHMIPESLWHPVGWQNLVVALMVTAFPALLAAIHGITVQGEFERLIKRSEALAGYLEDSIKRFNDIKPENSRYADAVGDHAVEAAQVMLEEVTDWQILYRAHGVELT